MTIWNLRILSEKSMSITLKSMRSSEKFSRYQTAVFSRVNSGFMPNELRFAREKFLQEWDTFRIGVGRIG